MFSEVAIKSRTKVKVFPRVHVIWSWRHQPVIPTRLPVVSLLTGLQVISLLTGSPVISHVTGIQTSSQDQDYQIRVSSRILNLYILYINTTSDKEVVDRYLEVKLGRVIGPLVRSEYPEVHISRFGVIPKNHQPGKWRLIVDLSHPEGASINDGIEPELCSLHYTSVDEAVQRLLAKEPGAMMVKMYIEGAYRIILVHPHDRPPLGTE